MNFRFFIFCVESIIFHFFCEFFMKFCSDFATKSRKEWRRSFRSAYSTACAWKVKLLVTSDVFRFFNWICENRLENCRNSEICENYSLLFISVLSQHLLQVLHSFSSIFGGPPRARGDGRGRPRRCRGGRGARVRSESAAAMTEGCGKL